MSLSVATGSSAVYRSFRNNPLPVSPGVCSTYYMAQTLTPEALDRISLPDRDLVRLHKAELVAALEAADGDRSALAKVDEAQRLEWTARQAKFGTTHLPLGAGHVKAVVEPTDDEVHVFKPAPVVEAKAPNTCRDCSVVIPPTGKKGRPAVRCDSCKAKLVEAEAAHKAAVSTAQNVPANLKGTQ